MNLLSRTPAWIRHPVAAVRVVVVLTLVAGLAHPLAMTAIAQVPGLHGQAQGSPLTGAGGKPAGSTLIGQSFLDGHGDPLPAYFQTRPSNAGDGYDASASAAGNLGPESTVDVLPLPGRPDSGTRSLLTQVCARSKAVGDLEHVDGARPFCTADGVGAVLGVFKAGGTTGRATRVVSLNQACPARPFTATYQGVRVECARPGEDYGRAVATPVRGGAPAHPVVPPDAVTASGSGLDPAISPAYARLQTPRVARERGMPEAAVRAAVDRHTSGRGLGVLGAPAVNVVELNADLDRTHPVAGTAAGTAGDTASSTAKATSAGTAKDTAAGAAKAPSSSTAKATSSDTAKGTS
ncbi:potassium-transporting ATPase subunit C [Streptomyces sp. TS71-3]|uniref:potassium-transporting ATPase subunit C n=1 Tax=Streptomyces sp. TS71-3 TaxID=2733862 RepID=UPI001B00A4AA|nr:potassium-transporting ATPase subunit C [Streptomyces sp. TS71-3]GHJ40439.1 potassium-transporting ATPase KdpC subunit [Streptomyces sp. TS71-3]